MTSLAFSTVAAVATAIGRTLSESAKVEIAARFLASIEHEEDLVVAARWLAGDHRDLPSIASTLPVRVYAALSGEEVDVPGTLDYELFMACRAMAGSAIEAIRMLLEAQSRAGLPPLVRSEELTVEQVRASIAELADVSGVAPKIELLAGLWQAMGPDEIATLHALLGRGAVAAGFGGELMSHAIARAFGQPLQLVRHAMAIEGDAGTTALDARRGGLEASFVRPRQLVPPMRALPIERTIDESGAIRLAIDPMPDLREYLVEERLPGARVQLHVWPDNASLGADETTVSLLMPTGRDVAPVVPGIVEALEEMPAGTVIDGQLMLFDTDGVAIDATAVERAASRREAIAIDEETSLYVAFDLLVAEGLSLLEQPLEERRFRLERLAEDAGVAVTRATTAADIDELERLYIETLADGGAGIVVKRRDSAYEFGRRSGAWLKAPGEPATILGVIRYASVGDAGRKGPPGELTFGVWLAHGEEPRLVNIGRVDCVLGDEDLERLDRRLQRLRGKRFGTKYEIEPRIVCELEYDAIRVSPRTDAGYTIRIACIRCIRWDLPIDSAASVADIEARHRSARAAGVLERAVRR